MPIADTTDVRQGTLALMVLKGLETLGRLHGYGIIRRVKQTNGELLAINYDTLYPALQEIEQRATSPRSGARRIITADQVLYAHALGPVDKSLGKPAIRSRRRPSRPDSSRQRRSHD